MEVILEVNSVKIQRQGGDFHGLRDKVMKLHTEFERVHRQLSTGAAPLTPENSLKRSAESPDTPSSSSKGNQGQPQTPLAQLPVLRFFFSYFLSNRRHHNTNFASV